MSDTHALAADADAAPAPGSSVRFVFPLTWERSDNFDQPTITMTTQMMEPHDPIWGLAGRGPYTIVAIDNVATNPRFAFCAIVESYSAELNQLFFDDDGDDNDDNANQPPMVWHLWCSHICSDPANLDRPPTDEEVDEWHVCQNRMLPIANPSPGCRGYFIPNNPELLAEYDEEPANVQH